MPKIIFEGQEITCPEEITDGDKAVLWFSAIEPSAKGGQVETIIRDNDTFYKIEAKAQPKGVAGFLDHLKVEKEYVNPAVTTAVKLQSMSQAELVLVDKGKVEKALKAGYQEVQMETALVKRISGVSPKPGEDIPEGF